MSNHILPKTWVPVNGQGTRVQLDPEQYATALEWAQRTEPGERLGILEVFDDLHEAGRCLELLCWGVLVGDRDGVTMPQQVRDHLLGSGG